MQFDSHDVDMTAADTVLEHESPDWQHDFLRLITLNIRCGLYSNLNVSLRALHQMRIDFGILMETKIDNDMYTRDCCGYSIFATHAKSKHQGGVALFYRTQNTTWWVEGDKAHGPNVISCILVSGNHRWNVIGAYIPPSEDDGETIRYINEAVQYRGTKDSYILLGDFNVDLDRPRDVRDDEIVSQVVLLALEDVGDYFSHPRGRWTWSQKRNERYYRSRTDYIMAQEIGDFQRWAIKIPRIHTDHRAIIAELRLGTFHAHRSYTSCRRSLPPFPYQQPVSQNDIRFEHLKQQKDFVDPKTARDRSWISKTTWTLIDKRVRAARWHFPSEIIANYSKAIRKSLRKDR
jgi:exonuclease III